MKSRKLKPQQPVLSLGLSLGLISGCAAAALQLPGFAQDDAPPSQAQPQAAATSDIQKLRDEIQLKAMQEVADKISLVASDMYNEASKGSNKPDPLDHPQKQAAKLVPGGVSGSTDISWSDAKKPSSEWLGVFASELDSWFPLFNEEMASVLIPDDEGSIVGQDWAQLQLELKDSEDMHQKLRMMSKTDPPDGQAVADLSRNLYYKMQGIKTLIEDLGKTISATDTKQDATPATWKQVSQGQNSTQTGGDQTSTASSGPTTTVLAGQVLKTSVGLSDLHECTLKMERTSRDLIGELERWNLLWGQPPTENKSSDMLWGGGLTREEVLSEFRNLPLTVFTMPNYVKFFSYRLPPRKKYLVTYTRQLGQQINMMARALNETEPPESTNSDWSQGWTEVQTLSKDVAARYINLLNLVDNTTDDRLKKSIRADQLTFGEPMAAIYSDVQKLGTLIKQLNNSLKQSGKSAAKAT